MRQKHPDETPARPNKYGAIFSELREAIASGKYRPGQRIPSEAQLSRTFGASRLTVGRALNELEGVGIIERRAGSGSYVSKIPEQRGRTFGLLIPELGETEIFEPICQGMARVTRITRDELLWGAATHADETHGQQALELCDYYIAKDVSGVFFAPLEHTPEKNEVNRRVVDAFEKAGIPLVLLDRDAVDYPQRSRCDLVGIDNRRAGYVVTDHLLHHGCKRIVFVASPNSAPTVEQRISGYVDALERSGIHQMLEIGDVQSAKWISRIAAEHQPDGFVCENDRTAGRLMLHLNELGFEIPSKMKIIGFDDVKYASLLHVPLTTLRQPCHDIGAAAVWAMIDRIAHPNVSARNVLLDCQLIERRSCGAEKC